MKNLMENRPLLVRLVNKQFEMIGKPEIKIQDIENGVWVEDKKGVRRVVEWWKLYFFPDEETYIKWKEWVVKELLKVVGKEMVELESEVNFIDLVYGMNVEIKKGSY